MEKVQRLYPDLSAQLGSAYLKRLGYNRCFYGLSGRGRREFLAVLRSDPLAGDVWKWLLLFSFMPPRTARTVGAIDLSEWLRVRVSRARPARGP
jgi:hypothetical protein